jgi:hypothetical protein
MEMVADHCIKRQTEQYSTGAAASTYIIKSATRWCVVLCNLKLLDNQNA